MWPSRDPSRSPGLSSLSLSLLLALGSIVHATAQEPAKDQPKSPAGFVEGRRGVGTFVAGDVAPPPTDDLKDLRAALQRWVDRARSAGLDDDALATLFADTVHPPAVSRVA